MPTLAIAIVCLSTLLGGEALGAYPAAEVTRFREALFIQADESQVPPATNPGWMRVTLPDRWRDQRPDQGGFGWYRFEVAGPRPADMQFAISLAGVNMNAEAFVNGIPVGSGGSMDEPVERNSNRPLFFAFPSGFLDAERNFVDVRLFAYANDVGSLGAVSIGPEADLRPEYRRRHFFQIEVIQTTTALLGLLTIFFGVLWIGAGRDPLYLWVALSAGAWAFVSINYWIQVPGVGHWTWVRMFYLALGTFAITLPILAHRLLGLSRRRIERALLGILGLYALLAAFLDDEDFSRIVNTVQVLWLGSGAYGVWILVRGWRSFSRWEAMAYGAGGVFCLALAGADLLDAWALGAGWRPHLMPYVGSVLVLCLTTTLGVRFSQSLQNARRSNRELEERVRSKTRELELNHARMRDLERSQVLADERGRMIREMHDGIGGQLVATLAMVQTGDSEPRQIANALRDALDDLRAVIDSMDPLIDDLGKLLGSMRARFDALMRRNDRRFVWTVGDLPRTPWLGPEQYLHILRIMQEAIANALRHADPTEIEVSVSFVESPSQGLRISVRDDGVATSAPNRSGRGTAHMKSRAREIGGSLDIVSLERGTCVELWLPSPRDDEERART